MLRSQTKTILHDPYTTLVIWSHVVCCDQNEIINYKERTTLAGYNLVIGEYEDLTTLSQATLSAVDAQPLKVRHSSFTSASPPPLPPPLGDGVR